MASMASIIFALAVSAVLIYPLIQRFHRSAFLVAALLLGLVFVFFAVQAPRIFSGVVNTESLTWVPQLGLHLGFRLDTVSVFFAMLVSGVGALVLLYCKNYFESDEDGLARFGAVFMGFSASMLGLVLADNIYLLFLFWEATSVFSFLLIGHAYWQRTSRASALQALMVTTAGGLAMLVGLVILHAVTGSSSLSEIVIIAPAGPLVTVAVYLLLAGALSKSAIFPFHFWLPGAMAAPTPVSAYLHAAAMVKAGIYLLLRITPGLSDVPGYSATLVLLGAVTMIIGGVRALKQFDIKLIVAHGTVSQLGLIVMVLGVSEPAALFAALALVAVHAIAKAPLFLIVGIIDHRTSTRDLRKLSGLWRQTPALAVIALLASASMAGFPPLLGFIAKESAFTELLALGDDFGLALIALIAFTVGSMLTVAYTARFMWGAFAVKREAKEPTPLRPASSQILIAPAVFAVLVAIGGFLAPWFDSSLRAGISIGPGDIQPGHLAVWHGFTLAFGLSLAAILGGLVIAWMVVRRRSLIPTIPERFSASHAYWVLTHWVDILAVRLTAVTQRGSLPFYLAVILSTLVLAIGGSLITDTRWPKDLSFNGTWTQISIAVVVIIAAICALRARTRFQAVVLVGVTGYGMATIFALHGAPDLALTQTLVETVTMIAFVLVIRRLPQRIRVQRPGLLTQSLRIGLSAGVGIVLGAVALVAIGSRVADPVSLEHPKLAYLGGHGKNVVNVMLVDIRGWDTLGELSVILAAATGVASLIFISTRVDRMPKISRVEARSRVAVQMRRVADPDDPMSRNNWLLAGRNLNPSRRSIMLEVVVRLLFHALMLLSFYLLLTGHNSPGGGFAGGLVAGLALVARYLAGGREELGATVPIDAGKILGAGLGLATLMAILPLFFGQAALASHWIDVDLGPFGILPLVTSTLFDIGVFLVVFGLILDVLRSLGGEVDKQEELESESEAESPRSAPSEPDPLNGVQVL